MLGKNEALKQSCEYCKSHGLDYSALSELSFYEFSDEYAFTKEVEDASKYDGLSGDAATMPKPVLIFLKNAGIFETTTYTDEYLRRTPEDHGKR